MRWGVGKNTREEWYRPQSASNEVSTVCLVGCLGFDFWDAWIDPPYRGAAISLF